ncbi:mechanosensitive ion channel family protein [Paraglaciecola arctica]|uniref:mechanosensitive ion channel family protein n=1 Tax=Paraglaciecola arctica TaxID=1128911 RepID=UPI001C074956|nr:mechanosensitive ion channel family protein [Paraglaciecola arctica]MBU3004557.1 mechanosensitive ion channel family protein [Paraglaciecola arctica]
MELLKIEKFWSLINDKLESWLEAGIKHLPNFVVAILIAIIFSVIANIAGKTLKKVLLKTLESPQIASLLASIFKMCILIAGVFVALDFLGLTGTVTSLLAGAGIVGLAIGFAFQDMTENLIAGIAMGIRKPFQIGDVVAADKVFGTVKTINLRNTLVETFFGQLEVIPNKILFRNILTNYSINGVRRIEVPVGISYADDPEQAAEVIKEFINQYDFVIRKEETAVFAKDFGDSSVNLLLWFWIDYPGEIGFMQARHQAVVGIKKALEKADILIPFPIRTLDFGAKGGVNLDTMIQSKVTAVNSDKSNNDNPNVSDSN